MAKARAKKEGRQLPEQRQRKLVAGASAVLRRGEPTPFAFQGRLIAHIRASLVLQGRWLWRDADAAGREIVLTALKAIGAKRPDWNEASTPNYAQAGCFSLFERTRCVRCGWQLPEGHRLYCSERCMGATNKASERAAEAAFQAAIAEGLI